MVQIYTWRIVDKLGINVIVARLNTDHATYPPADPAAGWSLGGVSAILRNPSTPGTRCSAAAAGATPSQ